MFGEFVADYVQECIKQGIQFPSDIRKCAEEEINRINDEIQKIELLRGRQGNLRAVIRHMGGNVKPVKVISNTMDFTMVWGELEDSFKRLCVSICNFIQGHGEKKLPREIIDAVRIESDPYGKAVYSAIKWLEHNNVIERIDTNEGRAIVKGSAWDVSKFSSQ